MNKVPFIVFQWNCRSIDRNIDHLHQHLVNRKYDILSLQSLNIQKERLPKLRKYYYPPIFDSDPQSGKIYTALYISQKYNYIPYDIKKVKKEEGIFSCSVKIKYKGKILIISSIYLPQGPNNYNTEWMKTLNNNNNNTYIITGDFNAHSPFWEKMCTHNSNNRFLENIVDSPLYLLNDGSITRIPDNPSHKPTSIDLTFISPILAPNTSWHTCQDTLGSDHIPIITSINVNNITEPDTNEDIIPKFNYKLANWAAFSSSLATFTTANIDIESLSIDDLYSVLTDLILTAAKDSIPQVKHTTNPKHKGNIWWTTACEEARSAKWLAFKKYLKYPTPSNLIESKKAKNKANRVMKQAKMEYWSSFCTNLSTNKLNLRTVWRKVKEMRHGLELPKYPILIDSDDLPTNKTKAEAFVNMFSKISRNEGLPQCDRDFRTEEENSYKIPVTCPIEEKYSSINNDISMNEIIWSQSMTSSTGSSVGLDGISKEMIIHLPASILSFLLIILNRCWHEGVLPSIWKTSVVVPIAKLDQNPSNLTSYRPIALTSTVCKLMEKILLERLTHFCSIHKIIPPNQAGFQKGRCCMEHIIKLTTQVKQQLARRKHIIATFYDVKKAYDQVWHFNLIKKLTGIHISGHMLSFIKSFISNRKIMVRINNTYSSSRDLEMGLPQGAVLSPLLFNILMADLPNQISEGTSLVQFADDMCMWRNVTIKKNIKKRSLEFIRSNYQREIDQVNTYMHSNGLTLSSEKTKLMFFHSGTEPTYLPQFHLGNTVLCYTQIVRFLGAYISNTLKWNKHIHILLEKGRQGLNLLKVISSQPWGQNITALRCLAYGLVRSRITYAQEAYFSAPDYLLRKLSSLDGKAFKLALGVPVHSHCLSSYKENGVLPLSYERRIAASKFIINARSCTTFCKTEIELDSRIHFSKRASNIAYVQSIFSYVSDIINLLPTKGMTISDRGAVSSVPPWDQKQAAFDIEHSEINKSKPVNILKSNVLEHISSLYTSYTHIYTDGSVLENSKSGAAFLIPSRQVSKQLYLGKQYSIFTAELVAIKYALLHIKNNIKTFSKILICSDSKAAIMAIKNAVNKKRTALIMEIKDCIHYILDNNITITFFWIPSHCDILHNETVDKYAKKAASNATGSETLSLFLDYHEYHSLIDKIISEQFNNALMSSNNHYTTHCLSPDLHNRIINCQLDPLSQSNRASYSTMAKLRLNALRTKYTHNILCKCGAEVSIKHLLLECPIVQNEIMNSTLRPNFEFQKPTLSLLLCNISILKQLTDILNNSRVRNVL